MLNSINSHLIALTIIFISAITMAHAVVWNPDLGNGTYQNPVIYADYSDPDVIRVGNDYWMVASSFSCFPGIPVLHSYDLVHWEIVNHVYESLPLGKYNSPAHGEGSWAPSIRFHDGKYYVYFCTPYDGLFVAIADHPRDKWNLSQILEVAKWEDPCPFWDDNGDAFLVHSIHRGGPVVLHRMSPDGLKLLDNGIVVYHDDVLNPVLEGLKMYKRNGWYYIFAPAGGVESGWQTVLRARNPYGPYEARKVLAQGESDVNGPHQGALIDTPDGSESWFVHFQSKGNLGRVTHLQPALWTPDDWIVIGEDPDADGIGSPVKVHRRPAVVATRNVIPQTSDEFNDSIPSLQWQWQCNPQKKWYSLSDNVGYLRLFAIPCPSENGNLYFAGNLYLQKIPAPDFIATTFISSHFNAAGERAGIITMGNQYSYIALVKESDGNRLAVVSGRNDKYAVVPDLLASVLVSSDNVFLRAELVDAGEVSYSFSLDGNTFTPLGPVCKVTPGTWIGAKTGIFCSSPNVNYDGGFADFDFFRLM